MDSLLTLLGQLGLGLATNGIYDYLKSILGKNVPPHELEKQIQDQMAINGVHINSKKIIKALAEKGYLSITNSHFYAVNSIAFGSTQGTASIGNNSSLTTKNSAVHIGENASIQTSGNAQIIQHKDGSITFHIGKD